MNYYDADNYCSKWESLSQLCEEYQLRMFDLSDLSLANLKTATYLYFFLRSHLLTSLLNSINTSDSSLNGFAKFGSVLKPGKTQIACDDLQNFIVH